MSEGMNSSAKSRAACAADETPQGGAKVHPNSLANLKPFKKGQPSANPSGRPKASYRVAELAREHTEEALATLVGVMNGTLLDGDGKPANLKIRADAARTLLDRGHGKSASLKEVKHDLGKGAGGLVSALREISARPTIVIEGDAVTEVPTEDEPDSKT